MAELHSVTIEEPGIPMLLLHGTHTSVAAVPLPTDASSSPHRDGVIAKGRDRAPQRACPRIRCQGIQISPAAQWNIQRATSVAWTDPSALDPQMCKHPPAQPTGTGSEKPEYAAQRKREVVLHLASAGAMAATAARSTPGARRNLRVSALSTGSFAAASSAGRKQRYAI
jgi:hypothetical protein